MRILWNVKQKKKASELGDSRVLKAHYVNAAMPRLSRIKLVQYYNANNRGTLFAKELSSVSEEFTRKWITKSQLCMKQISFPKHRRQKINFEKLSGEQVCKSAIAIRFNLLQVGPSDASLFFDLLPHLFLLFMLWEAISKFYSVCWWYPRDRQVAGELSVVSYCSELASGELEPQDLEFSKCCRH